MFYKNKYTGEIQYEAPPLNPVAEPAAPVALLAEVNADRVQLEDFAPEELLSKTLKQRKPFLSLLDFYADCISSGLLAPVPCVLD